MQYEEIDQIVSTTHNTINKMLEYKNGPDALALYFRYIQQRKQQENNQTLSSTRFMKKAMGRGQGRFTKAKKILVDNGFIKDIQIKDSDGKIMGRYIKVNFIINNDVPKTDTPVSEMDTPVSENQSLENPSCGKQVQNTLVEKENTLVEKENTPTDFFEVFWKLFPHARKSKKAETKKLYSKLDDNDVMEEVKLLNRQIRVGLIDHKYIPACERWIRDFVKTSDIVRDSILKKIVYAIMDNKGPDRPKLGDDFISDFGQDLADKYRKEWSKEKNGMTLKFGDQIYHV